MAKSKKLTTKMRAKIKKANDPIFARKFVTYGVIISSIMVALSIFVTVYFNAEAVAHRKFEFLAREYYETYYHEKFFENMTEEAFEAKIETFEKTGFQPVLLRQLLLYQNGKYSSYKKYFEMEGFSCDKNTTSAKFYPVAPYGPKDYTVEFNYSCQYE
ncbi:hypothetical protein IJH46_02910 [Candidatus Saccharibacteria bacterium]|nr:hypothetical protein [Candidatus Saccharibacteria bacterium]